MEIQCPSLGAVGGGDCVSLFGLVSFFLVTLRVNPVVRIPSVYARLKPISVSLFPSLHKIEDPNKALFQEVREV